MLPGKPAKCWIFCCRSSIARRTLRFQNPLTFQLRKQGSESKRKSKSCGNRFRMSSELNGSDIEQAAGTLFVVSSPSGGGKGTLIQRVLKVIPDLSYSVS